jgi:hypothetical protein
MRRIGGFRLFHCFCYGGPCFAKATQGRQKAEGRRQKAEDGRQTLLRCAMEGRQRRPCCVLVLFIIYCYPFVFP